MRRCFAKFYNEKPHKPIKIPVELKNNLRNATSTQQHLRRTLKEFRSQLPLLSLIEISKLSRAHIKAFHFIPNLLSPTDPKLEPHIRKSFYKAILEPQFNSDLQYYEDKLLILDKSAESRKNYLLAKEAEEVEKSIRANEELKRIERLRDVEKIKYRPEVQQIEQVLDGEIDTQLVVMDTHTVLSSKGVVKMTAKPGKMATFKDLTGQELSNYICFNLQSVEQALQMTINSSENLNFDMNMRAKMLQKIVFLQKNENKDSRLVELIKSLNVDELNKKNVANTLWAIGKLYNKVPAALKQVTEELVKRFVQLVPVSNSMNLAYAVDGLKRLGIFHENIVQQVSNRFVDLIESVPVPKKPKPSEVPVINVPLLGHSYFYKSKDLTVPQTPVPAQAIFKLLKYLKSAQNLKILPFLYKKSAEIINAHSLYELDKNLLIEGLSIFSHLSEQQLHDPSIQKLILNMSQLTLHYYQELTLPQISLVSKSILNAKGFKHTAWFKVLQLKSFESIEFFSDPADILPVCLNFVKYFVAVKHGRDLDIEPFAWVFNTFYVEDTLFDKLAELCATKELPDEVLNGLGKYLGIVGYSVNTTTDETVAAVVAAAVQGYPHECLKEVSDEVLLKLTKGLERFEDVCELAAVFRKSETKVNWEFFVQFYENNKEFIVSQPHRIALAWALGREVEVKYEAEMLTKTEFKMLEGFIRTEKILVDR